MKRRMIPVRQLASGDKLEIPVFEFQGTGNAPSLYIQANVHGAEVQGNLVSYLLLDYFLKNPPRGNVTIVPKANPYGLNAKLGEYTFGRFDPTNGKNYNRNYYNLVSENSDSDFRVNLDYFIESNMDKNAKTILENYKKSLLRCLDNIGHNKKEYGSDYGDYICYQLQNMAQRSDIVLDLHTASNSINHLYAPDYTVESSLYLGIENFITVQNEFLGAMDEACFIPWKKLQKKLKERLNLEIDIPVESYTVELGSQEKADEEMAQEQFQNILNFLKFKKIVDGDAIKPSFELNICKPHEYIQVFAPHGGIVSYKVAPGDDIQKGDVIANVYQFDYIDEGKPITEAKKEILSPHKGRVINLTDSSIIHEHMEIARMMI